MEPTNPISEVSQPQTPGSLWVSRPPGALSILAAIFCWGMTLGMFALRVQNDVLDFRFIGQVPNLGRALLIALLLGAVATVLFLRQTYQGVMNRAVGIEDPVLTRDTAAAAIGFVALLLVLRV